VVELYSISFQKVIPEMALFFGHAFPQILRI
jgi:hypothetical protein